MTPERRLDRMEEFVQDNRSKIWREVYRNYKRMEKDMRAELSEGNSLRYLSRGEQCSKMLSMCDGNSVLSFGLSGNFELSLLFNPVI